MSIIAISITSVIAVVIFVALGESAEALTPLGWFRIAVEIVATGLILLAIILEILFAGNDLEKWQNRRMRIEAIKNRRNFQTSHPELDMPDDLELDEVSMDIDDGSGSGHEHAEEKYQEQMSEGDEVSTSTEQDERQPEHTSSATGNTSNDGERNQSQLGTQMNIPDD